MDKKLDRKLQHLIHRRFEISQLLPGINAWTSPLYMVYLGQRSGLSRIEWKPRSSPHLLGMFTKLCDKYQRDSKNNEIH